MKGVRASIPPVTCEHTSAGDNGGAGRGGDHRARSAGARGRHWGRAGRARRGEPGGPGEQGAGGAGGGRGGDPLPGARCRPGEAGRAGEAAGAGARGAPGLLCLRAGRADRWWPGIQMTAAPSTRGWLCTHRKVTLHLHQPVSVWTPDSGGLDLCDLHQPVWLEKCNTLSSFRFLSLSVWQGLDCDGMRGVRKLA